MKFFIPFAESEEQAIKVLEATAEFIGIKVPPLTEMVYSISYTHNGKDMVATVDQDIDSYYSEPAPKVLAIFPPQHSSDPYKICLRDRGVKRGSPIYTSGPKEVVTFSKC